ncbi:MAG: acetate--CoA ligase family protein, partial [Bacteriovoracaceae bacterium]|nr:acetate--CoA ligase family protein [Bacteriovoracaceae bacterium]
LPAKFVKGYIETLAAQNNVKAFIVFSAGFSEMGEDGRKLEEEIVAIVNKHNASLIGPNCIGVITPSYNGIFAGPIPKQNPNGCDFVSCSGATAVFVIEKGIPMGLTFASLFSVGNSAQISVEEIVKYWDETFDPQKSSRVKLLYMESIDHPQVLLKHTSSLVKKGCRIAAIKSGTSEAGTRAASSHTGALATSDLVVDALFKKAGIVRCYSREELVITAGIFMHDIPRGKNVAIITQAGGPGVMLTDSLEKGGLCIPQMEGEYADQLLSKLYPGSSVSNPVDFLVTGTAQQLENIIDDVENHFNNIDVMVIIFGSPGLFDSHQVYDVINSKMKDCSIPIFVVLPSIVSGKKDIDYFKSLDRVFFSDEVSFGNALTNVVTTLHADKFETDNKILFCQEFSAKEKDQIRSIIESGGNGYLPPQDVQKLLDLAGISRVNEKITDNRDDAIKFSQEIGYPQVMKIVGPVHKTDVGGVILNIKSADDAALAFDKLMINKEATSVLIQPMIDGLELFIGCKAEERFGHLILCGLGGIFIETIKDFTAALCPVENKQSIQMIESLKSYPLLKGVRGQAGINIKAFSDTIQRLSSLLSIAPEIDELDLNPLFGTREKVVAVDGRIKIARMR